MRDGEYVDGKKSGLWISYFANGNKMSEGTYVNGNKHGAWTQCWPNGNKKSEATFVDGKNTGYYACYYENGNTQWEGYYNPIRGVSADGTKEGVWLQYDKETKAVCRKFTYKRGSRARPDEYPPYREPPKIGPPPDE